MQSEFYQQYMKSDKWRSKCQERTKIAGNKCEMCGRLAKDSKRLQIHHITYKRLGRENVYTDLICLCGHCHVLIHRYYDRIREPCEKQPARIEKSPV